jgi:hypothetical protein
MMNDTQRIKAIQIILVVQETNANDEDGDKYLSDAELAIEAIYDIAQRGDMGKAIRDHFITREMAHNAILDSESGNVAD